MAFLDTAYGKTYFQKHGKGQPLVILHGGPGCESSYLIAGLMPLAQWRTLYFFDQFGCGHDSNLPEDATFEKTVAHAEAFIEALNLMPGSLGLLGHSFGAHMAFGLMPKLRAPLRELVLLNPVPPTEKLRAKIQVSLTSEQSARIKELTPIKTVSAGIEIMNTYSKIYCETWPTPVKFEYHSFNMRLCAAVQNSMGDFDFRPLFRLIPKRSLLFKGENDFIGPELLTDYDQAFSNVIQLERAKHMPFLDRANDFLDAVTPYFQTP